MSSYKTAEWEIENFGQAVAIASERTAEEGRLHLAVDRGVNVSPRFGVVAPPQVGDPVSFTFNGDTYPCGHVVSVTAGTARIVRTDTGCVFYRRKLTAGWLCGTWWLVHGHQNSRNPSF